MAPVQTGRPKGCSRLRVLIPLHEVRVRTIRSDGPHLDRVTTPIGEAVPANFTRTATAGVSAGVRFSGMIRQPLRPSRASSKRWAPRNGTTRRSRRSTGRPPRRGAPAPADGAGHRSGRSALPVRRRPAEHGGERHLRRSGHSVQVEFTGISAGSTVVHARPVPSVVLSESPAVEAPPTSAASTGMRMLTGLLGALEAEQDVREWSRLFDAVETLARALGKYELNLGMTWYGADGGMRRAQLTERGRRYVERLRETRPRDQEIIISGTTSTSKSRRHRSACVRASGTTCTSGSVSVSASMRWASPGRPSTRTSARRRNSRPCRFHPDQVPGAASAAAHPVSSSPFSTGRARATFRTTRRSSPSTPASTSTSRPSP